MKKIYTITLFFSIISLVSSCATTSSKITFHEIKTTADDINAIVYVYRLPSILGASVSWSVQLDDKEIAKLKKNAYAVLRATPGMHRIQVGKVGHVSSAIVMESTKDLRTFIADPKGVYFFRCHGGSQRWVTREEAMTEIVRMKFDMGK